MTTALIGHTGFVGGNLALQRSFDEHYNSKNFREMSGKNFSEVVCAGVQAVKWKANKEPDWDRQGIFELEEILKTIKTDHFILISTIDVYPVLRDADETFDCGSLPNHPYGSHRLAFENFCRSHFNRTTIIRLPGLFGDGLKKNVIFDLIHDNNLQSIQPESEFQYYFLGNIWQDISVVLREGIELINFFPQAIKTKDIAAFFAEKSIGSDAASPVYYSLQTRYADLWKSSVPGYMKSHDQSLAEIAAFLKSVS